MKQNPEQQEVPLPAELIPIKDYLESERAEAEEYLKRTSTDRILEELKAEDKEYDPDVIQEHLVTLASQLGQELRDLKQALHAMKTGNYRIALKYFESTAPRASDMLGMLIDPEAVERKIARQVALHSILVAYTNRSN